MDFEVTGTAVGPLGASPVMRYAATVVASVIEEVVVVADVPAVTDVALVWIGSNFRQFSMQSLEESQVFAPESSSSTTQ